QLDQWDDKQTGQKRSKHKVVVESVEFLGARGGEEGGNGGGRPASSGRPAARSAPPDEGGDEYGGGRGSSEGDNIPFGWATFRVQSSPLRTDRALERCTVTWNFALGTLN